MFNAANNAKGLFKNTIFQHVEDPPDELKVSLMIEMISGEFPEPPFMLTMYQADGSPKHEIIEIIEKVSGEEYKALRGREGTNMPEWNGMDDIIYLENRFTAGMYSRLVGDEHVYQSYVMSSETGTAFGNFTDASGYASFAEGSGCQSMGDYSHAEGMDTRAEGVASHAEGEGTKATGGYSHAEGNGSRATGTYSHAEGIYSHAEGIASHAEGIYSHAEGAYSHAAGYYTHSKNMLSTAVGRFNKISDTDNTTKFVTDSNALYIGNGKSSSERSNAFRVTFDGRTYGLSAFNSTGADYAEFFEWLDSNPDSEDRVGRFVTLDGDKIKFAEEGDYIIGIVSATASVIGDSHSDQWSRKYITDVWGRPQTEKVLVEYEDGEEREDEVFQINPHWDNEEEYIPRENRKEWDAVGMMGKLYVMDDGTCEVNGYCKPSTEGIATKSTEGYRVIKRIDANIVKVILK